MDRSLVGEEQVTDVVDQSRQGHGIDRREFDRISSLGLRLAPWGEIRYVHVSRPSVNAHHASFVLQDCRRRGDRSWAHRRTDDVRRHRSREGTRPEVETAAALHAKPGIGDGCAAVAVDMAATNQQWPDQSSRSCSLAWRGSSERTCS